MKKRLKFQELILISLKEKKAKKIKFHPVATVITGENKEDNDIGKSSVVKNLYYTFGATPKMDDDWKKANVINIVRFLYDDQSYYFLRTPNEYALFDEKSNLIKYFTQTTGDLDEFFAKMFDFCLPLTSKAGKTITAPPTFSFLPFYLDQDWGWDTRLNSFRGIEYFQKNEWWKKVIDFHTGIRPSNYYYLCAQKTQQLILKSEKTKELELMVSLKEKTLLKFGKIIPSINIGDYKNEIERLVIEINNLKEGIEKDKECLVGLYNQKNILEAQIRILSVGLEELDKDLDYALEELDEVIECPICGANHQNSFIERFSLSKDKEQSQYLLMELRENLNIVNKRIKEIKLRLEPRDQQYDELNSLLEVNKGTIKLADLIKNEGRTNFITAIDEEIAHLILEIGKIKLKEKTISKQLSMMENAEVINKIKKRYADLMKNYLGDLELQLDEKKYKDIYSKIDLTGNRNARALVVLFFALTNLIYENSSSVVWPIVIDSPHQQEPGDRIKRNILDFIETNTPKDSQLIISLVDNLDKNFGGEVIKLKSNPYRKDDENTGGLLRKEEYEENSVFLMNLLNKLNNFKKVELENKEKIKKEDGLDKFLK